MNIKGHDAKSYVATFAETEALRLVSFALAAFVCCTPPSQTVIQPTAWYNESSPVDEWLSPDAAHDEPRFSALVSASSSQIVITADMGDLTVPRGYRQAMSSTNASYWRDAIAKELGGLVALHTWDIVPTNSMPLGSNLMNCHFVFAIKRKQDGSIEKFKARLVADGNTQKHGVDFDRVFATVVKTLTIRLVIAIAAARDYNLSSIDVRQAYLQAELKEDLYMRMPPGLPSRPGHVCKLRRSLYGLRQAGREWAVLFSKFLTEWGMVRSTIDVCLYTYVSQSSKAILWVLIYVDDALIADSDSTLRDKFVADLGSRFPVEDKGELSWILNIAVSRDRKARSITLSQELYINDLLTKCEGFVGIETTRSFDSPLEEGADISPAQSPALDSDEYSTLAPQRTLFMTVVGGLLWLANMTRFDIAYAASSLARVLSNPGRAHLRAATRVLIYLRCTKSRALTFRPDSSLGLDVYVDSDWASKFSCSGILCFFMGCVFHWFSKVQRSVSLSSAEAEFFGAMLCARDVAFLRDLLVDLGIVVESPSTIYCDSKSDIDMSLDPVAFKKTKHIMRAAEFLRDLVAREVVRLVHLSGRVMIADILTKAVARPTFIELIKLLDSYSAYRADVVPALAAAVVPAATTCSS